MAKKTEDFARAYARSLKLRGMDGPIDLYLYRPLGFLAAWLLSFTKASPNAVTVLSMIFGLCAGLVAIPGSPRAFLACAVFFQLANIADCADGQLARLTGRGSLLGRVIDGSADLVVNASVFLGSLAGLIRSGLDPRRATFLVLLGSLAKIMSCAYYDRAITRYAAVMEGPHDGAGAPDELSIVRAQIASSSGGLGLLWRIYAAWLRIQEYGETRGASRAGHAAMARPDSAEARRAYQDAMLPLLSLWSFAIPSASALDFLVFAAMGRMGLYFEACIALGAATLALMAAQRIIELRLAALIPALQGETLPALDDQSD